MIWSLNVDMQDLLICFCSTELEIIWVDTTKCLSWCVSLSCWMSWESRPEEKGSVMAYVPCLQAYVPSSTWAFFPFLTKVVALSPFPPKHTLMYIWSYLAREPRCMNRTDEVSCTLSICSGGRREDGDEGQLTTTAGQLSQVDRQWKHLKPELIPLSEREIF